ncbi:MAG: hypothetical protein FWE23_03290 [Chitinivibrionia bacterium]|nr:hypothetical protein [Chitinivibrionia bacterium]
MLLLLATGAIYTYFIQASTQNQIREAVVRIIAEATGAQISIDDIHIGFFSATVSNFSLAQRSQAFSVQIEKIKINVGLIQIPRLRRNFNPQDFVDKITIINPRLRFVIYAESEMQDSDEIEIPRLLVSEWSSMILENVPFQTALIRNCEILILTRTNRILANFSGLNGDLFRRHEELSVNLSGISGDAKHNNIEISARISQQSDRQFLSTNFSNVQVLSPLMELDGDISFVLDGQMDFFFKEDYFPEAIVPSGELAVKNIKVNQQERGITFSGGFDFLASGGIVYMQNFAANFGIGQMDAFAKMNLAQNGQTEGVINLKIPVDENLLITKKLNFSLDDILNPQIKFQCVGAVSQKAENLLNFTANGDISSAGRVNLQNLDMTSKQFGKGHFTGFVVPGINYSLSGNFNLSTQLYDTTSAKASVKMAIKSDDFVSFPHISLESNNMRLQRPTNVLQLPKISAKNSRDTLNFTLNSSDFQLSGSVSLSESFAYSADLKVGENTMREVLQFFGQEAVNLERASVSGNIYGDVSHLNFNTSASFVIPNYGNFSLASAGQISENQRDITINSLRWQKSPQTALSFSGNINYSTDSDWTVALAGNGISANANFSEDFSRINSGEVRVERFPLTFFNAFIPRNEEDKNDNLLQGGEFSGYVNLSGNLDEIQTSGKISVRNLKIEHLENIEIRTSFSSLNGNFNIPELTVEKSGEPIINAREIKRKDEQIFGEIDIDSLDLRLVLPFFNITEAQNVSGKISMLVNLEGDKILAEIMSNSVSYERFSAQKLRAKIVATQDSIILESFEGEILGISATANFRADHKNFRIGDAQYSVELKGDFLAAAGTFPESPVGGKGVGEIRISGGIRDGELEIRQGSRVSISQAQLAVYPFARDTLENVSANIQVLEDGRVSLALNSGLRRRTLRINNDHNVGELTPFRFANLDFGVLRVWTGRGGIPVFLPGFMENRRGNVGYIETAPKGNIPTFTVASHPEGFVMLAGTLLLRRAEITFPLLDDVVWEVDIDPIPHIYFDLNIRPADRTVNYFFQTGREDRRRGFRLIECTLDPSGSTVGVRGNDANGTLRITGQLRSFNGFIFFGRMFDRNFEVGLDFQPELLPDGSGYDNLPIIWGSAQTNSDKDRMERITVRLKTRDPQTGELRDRGRFTELVIVPEGDNRHTPQDEFAAEFFEDVGRDFIENPGTIAAGIGDAYITGFFLNYWGRQLARRVGLDIIRFESTIIGNTVDFLTARQLDENLSTDWEHLLFANASFVAGRYINNEIFLRYQGGFATDDEFQLIPTHKIGIEYQPFPFLMFDVNYGFFRERETQDFISNPSVGVQLRLPIRRRPRPFANDFD